MHPSRARLGTGQRPPPFPCGAAAPGAGRGRRPAPGEARGPRTPAPARPRLRAPHLRQVLVVEQMRLAGLEAVLALALVEDVGLEFPARVLLGRRHDRRGGGEAQQPGPARAERRTAAGGAAAPCTAGLGGSGRGQRGRHGMPPSAAASQPGRGRRPERSPGGEGGLADAGMRTGPPSHDGAALHGAPRHLRAGPRPRALTERTVPAACPHSRHPATAGPWTRPPGPAASPRSDPPLRRRVAAGRSRSPPPLPSAPRGCSKW